MSDDAWCYIAGNGHRAFKDDAALQKASFALVAPALISVFATCCWANMVLLIDAERVERAMHLMAVLRWC